ncbi:eukaryotic translation initiation factor 3 subunit D-1-like [Drosophila ficusphila]|uniref:eukaryotic translation initiation factor 3 subunit D-1-like n=1 Tax=Drosophila ficusphila TaxID=30025 RepID=UPI001C8A69E0|nr:eukaryotic translation initiation factor 3 subunit D-1-like [Drosophila ficusphila]XP_043064681.1 eukaryotic translation initiation factor 3 subunit D-1-like [Drosophila ficusphila]
MDNAWGILRCIIDLVMKQKDGKYLIMKDPNKPIIRLYDISDNTFDSDDSDDGEGAPTATPLLQHPSSFGLEPQPAKHNPTSDGFWRKSPGSGP